jgi:hypothetical protein
MSAATRAKLLLWKERFHQFQNSHLTIQQFCHRIGCSATTFYYWKQIVERQADSGSAKAVGQSAAVRSTRRPAALRTAAQTSAFVPVVVRGGVVKRILVRLKDGTRIDVPSDALDVLGLILQHARRGA